MFFVKDLPITVAAGLEFVGANIDPIRILLVLRSEAMLKETLIIDSPLPNHLGGQPSAQGLLPGRVACDSTHAMGPVIRSSHTHPQDELVASIDELDRQSHARFDAGQALHLGS